MMICLESGMLCMGIIMLMIMDGLFICEYCDMVYCCCLFVWGEVVCCECCNFVFECYLWLGLD